MGKKVTLNIGGMHCASCGTLITKKLDEELSRVRSRDQRTLFSKLS